MAHRPWYLVARERAKQLGISYQQIADQVHVSKGAVGHWLTGRNRPRLEQIAGIAAVLDTTVAALVAEDAYFVVDETERAILDAVREVPAEYRAQITQIITAYRQAVAPTKPTK